MSALELAPRWLGPTDHGWLAALLAAYERMEGRPVRELDELLSIPLTPAAPPARLRLARRVLDELWRDRVGSERAPEEIRTALFRAGACAPSRDEAVAIAARELGLGARELERALFADLPSERLLVAPQHPPRPLELALRCNHALARSLLARSSGVRLEIEGDARAVVRACKLRGLVCVVHPEEAGARIEISGPLALFRATRVYGRALASLVPALAGARRFRLRALVVADAGPRSWVVTDRDPVFFEGMRPPTFDSAVEESFAKRFLRLTPDWDLVREPEPVPAGDALVFPDFALVHRRDPSRRWLLEIVGFWTPEYLRTKLERLRAASVTRLVLCVSDKLACAGEELPEDARIVRFKTRVDPREVLAAIGERLPARR